MMQERRKAKHTTIVTPASLPPAPVVVVVWGVDKRGNRARDGRNASRRTRVPVPGAEEGPAAADVDHDEEDGDEDEDGDGGDPDISMVTQEPMKAPQDNRYLERPPCPCPCPGLAAETLHEPA